MGEKDGRKRHIAGKFLIKEPKLYFMGINWELRLVGQGT
jgi:hypothetical protein